MRYLILLSFIAGCAAPRGDLVDRADVSARGDTGPDRSMGARARDLGVPFEGRPGVLNAITDVDGVQVGHRTVVRGDGATAARTGVTAVLPNGALDTVFGACVVHNGDGEMTGTRYLDEKGYLISPVVITNTISVGTAHSAVVKWSRDHPVHDAVNLPVVGETWDGFLNDIYGFHVTEADVMAALDDAAGGPVAEGNVGGGTGMVCHAFKGGIGTASRIVRGGHTVGVLVQANHGDRASLRIAGVPVGAELEDLHPEVAHARDDGDGSIIVVVATDAPLLPHQLERVARRASMGLARNGSFASTYSGDIFLAFSTRPVGAARRRAVSAKFLAEEAIDAVFRGTVEATEEAIVNALVAAETMTGRDGNRVHALPHDRLRVVLRRYGRLEESP